MAYNFSKNKPNINELNRIAAREKEAALKQKPKKKMKKLLVVLGLVVGFFGVKAIVNSLQEPSSGMVVVMDDPMINEDGGVDGTTVMAESEVASETYIMGDLNLSGVVGDAPGEEGYVAPAPVVVKFEPLSFNKGSLSKFAKANGAKVIKLAPHVQKYLKSLGVETDKGVKIDGALYIKVGSKRYVVYKGELIKL